MGFHKPSCMFVKMGKGVGRTTLNFERERVFFNCIFLLFGHELALVAGGL